MSLEVCLCYFIFFYLREPLKNNGKYFLVHLAKTLKTFNFIYFSPLSNFFRFKEGVKNGIL